MTEGFIHHKTNYHCLSVALKTCGLDNYKCFRAAATLLERFPKIAFKDDILFL